MGRAIDRLHLLVVRGMLVLVPHDEAYRRTRCLSLVDAGQEPHLVVLLPRRRNPRLPRLPAVQLPLDKRLVHLDTGGAPIDDPPDTRSMRLAERCQAVYISKRIHADTLSINGIHHNHCHSCRRGRRNRHHNRYSRHNRPRARSAPQSPPLSPHAHRSPYRQSARSRPPRDD